MQQKSYQVQRGHGNVSDILLHVFPHVESMPLLDAKQEILRSTYTLYKKNRLSDPFQKELVSRMQKVADCQDSKSLQGVLCSLALWLDRHPRTLPLGSTFSSALPPPPPPKVLHKTFTSILDYLHWEREVQCFRILPKAPPKNHLEIRFFLPTQEHEHRDGSEDSGGRLPIEEICATHNAIRRLSHSLPGKLRMYCPAGQVQTIVSSGGLVGLGIGKNLHEAEWYPLGYAGEQEQALEGEDCGKL